MNEIILHKQSGVTYFCSTRQGGVSRGNYASLNLSPYSGDDFLSVEKNRRILKKKLGNENLHLITPYQTHETQLRIITHDFFNLSIEQQNSFLYGVDALVTSLHDVCIAVATADCVPLIFTDYSKKVIGVAHAGWRGTCSRIAKITIDTMVNECGCDRNEIKVFVGPSISPAVYEVGQEVIFEFENAGFEMNEIMEPKGDKFLLDLWNANLQVLLSNGILLDNVLLSNECTFTLQDKYFSARRLGINSGRMLSGIFISR